MLNRAGSRSIILLARKFVPEYAAGPSNFVAWVRREATAAGIATALLLLTRDREAVTGGAEALDEGTGGAQAVQGRKTYFSLLGIDAQKEISVSVRLSIVWYTYYFAITYHDHAHMTYTYTSMPFKSSRKKKKGRGMFRGVRESKSMCFGMASLLTCPRR